MKRNLLEITKDWNSKLANLCQILALIREGKYVGSIQICALKDQ